VFLNNLLFWAWRRCRPSPSWFTTRSVSFANLAAPPSVHLTRAA